MLVLGLMSGTSLDGIDFALCRFNDSADKIKYKIEYCKTISYSETWVDKLKSAHELGFEALEQLSEDYGLLLARLVKNELDSFKVKPDLIASHGHTVLHDPANGITLQIGNGPEIFNETKIPVVCDFRTQDVKLGGQGAPLVPVGDVLLFPGYDCCVNLGGFVNLSFEENNKRKAYDVCPMNIVMNDLALIFGMPYDADGAIAKSGDFNAQLFNALNQLDFYQKKAPKSLGKEWVLKFIWPLLKDLPPKNCLRTFTEHAAFQLANNLKAKQKILVTGGGAYNSFFMACVSKYYKGKISIPESNLVEFKEALVFALLGFLKWNDKINVLSSVTGANKNHASGKIYK